LSVRAPGVNDKRVDEATGERLRFCSAILPAWCRKSPKVTEVLPLLYLHGLSSKDFGPALEGFLGTDAGLSAATITRLTVQWQDEARAFNERDLSSVDYVYVWADGIHVGIRLDEEKLCLLVLIGVRVDGTKQLIALADGYRESAGSWADLLRDCARRGMLAVGDGALGFWGALREVFPATREQRCWFHKIANVLSALPKSAHPGAKKALAEIWNAEDREHARRAAAAFKLAYGAKFAKAVAKVTDDLDELLAFYDYPAEHWIHLRTTNPIESTFATVRHRTKVTKGPGSKAAGIAMAFKLIQAAQDRWRAVNAPHLVALVRAGATFKRGKLVERHERATAPTERAAYDEDRVPCRVRLRDRRRLGLPAGGLGSAGPPTLPRTSHRQRSSELAHRRGRPAATRTDDHRHRRHRQPLPHRAASTTNIGLLIHRS
jgi:putative transposase